MNNIKIFEVKEFHNDDIIIIRSLLAQLTSNPIHFTAKNLRALINSQNSHLFFLNYNEDVIGMLTLGEYFSPTGKKWWIEDVIIDNHFRGLHFGKILVEFAIKYVQADEDSILMLTSNPQRIVANLLYQSTGFQKKETNVYQISVTKRKTKA